VAILQYAEYDNANTGAIDPEFLSKRHRELTIIVKGKVAVKRFLPK